MKEIIEKSIIDLWNQTRMLYLAIAMSINNTYNTKYTSKDIVGIVKKYKLKFKPFKPLSESEILEVVDKYVNQKMKYELIGLEYGVGKNYIFNILKDKGVMRKIGESNIKYTKEEMDKVVELYKTGKMLFEISKETGIEVRGISFILDKFKDLPRRSPQKYTLDETFFEKIDTKEKAYVFGLLMADGCNFRKNPNNLCVKLELQERDKDIIIKVKDILKFTGVLYFKDKNSKNKEHQNTWTLAIYSKKLSDDLYKLGMLDNKSLTKEFPTCVPEQFMSHFVRGYFDGNGSISLRASTNLPTTSITSNFGMIEDLKKIYNNLNIKFNFSPKNKVYDIFVYGHNYNRILREYLYKDADDLYIERKHKKFYMFK